jgi:KaiC/GvpD/RAD55 family RecA-like ATPase
MDVSKAKSGIPGLDRMLGGGFSRNSVVAVAGGTGSGRTIFVSQFLVKGALDFGEPGLFLSFDERKGSVASNLASFGWDLSELEKKQKFTFIEYPHNELAAFVEQESALKDLIETLGIKRVVIDSITPYAYMFTTQEERRIATLKLVNAVKGWKVTCLISAETVPGAEDIFPHTISGVESFCDGFINLSFRRRGERRSREVEIVKLRGSRHEHEFRPATIDMDGFVIGNGDESAEGKLPAKKKKLVIDI